MGNRRKFKTGTEHLWDKEDNIMRGYINLKDCIIHSAVKAFYDGSFSSRELREVILYFYLV